MLDTSLAINSIGGRLRLLDEGHVGVGKSGGGGEGKGECIMHGSKMDKRGIINS